MERTERERANQNQLDRERGALQLEGIRVGALSWSPRQEQQHRLVAQSPHGEGEHRGR